MSETLPRRSQRIKGGGKKPARRTTNRKKGGDELPAPAQRTLLSRSSKVKLAERGFHKRRGYSESPQKQSSSNSQQSHASTSAREDGDANDSARDAVVDDIPENVNEGDDLVVDDSPAVADEGDDLVLESSHKVNEDETSAAISVAIKEGEGASVYVEEVLIDDVRHSPGDAVQENMQNPSETPFVQTPERNAVDHNNHEVFGSPEAQKILANFKGSILDASDVSSSDSEESISVIDLDDSALDDNDFAADELGPSTAQLRTPRQRKSNVKSG